MNTANFTNVIATENDIFFMLNHEERNTLFNGSIEIEDIEYLNITGLSNYSTMDLKENLIPMAINSHNDENSEWSLNELLAVYTSKIFHGSPPFKKCNCFVFYMKENRLQHVGALKINDLDDAIDTSLNMINNFIYN
jgi:hypothetical protein